MNAQVKQWCRRQCEIQHATTTRDILGMEYAWGYAETIENDPITMQDIKRLAEYIDSAANPGGKFRIGPAVFMGGGSAVRSDEIEYRLTNLFNWLNNYGLTPDAFYQTLMWIHPFKDGNGRVGALVYNMMNGTINNPIDPPEYK